MQLIIFYLSIYTTLLFYYFLIFMYVRCKIVVLYIINVHELLYTLDLHCWFKVLSQRYISIFHYCLRHMSVAFLECMYTMCILSSIYVLQYIFFKNKAYRCRLYHVYFAIYTRLQHTSSRVNIIKRFLNSIVKITIHVIYSPASWFISGTILVFVQFSAV